MLGREILIYLSLKYQGDYDSILKAINEKEYIDAPEALPPINAKVLTILDEEYPEYLKRIFRPPFVLYYYGDISLISDYSKNLAVVGTRSMTEYGLNATNDIVKNVAKKVTIVSGLAKGVDTIAHKIAIENGSKTIAVLGSGIDDCYPIENLDLYNEIKKNHLLISEYPFSSYAYPNRFPFRNRLIAAFSKGVLVTEAYRRSGTSITVNWALSFDRDVYAVPYPTGQRSFCNQLISEGAYLIEDGKTLLEMMGIHENKPIFEI